MNLPAGFGITASTGGLGGRSFFNDVFAESFIALIPLFLVIALVFGAAAAFLLWHLRREKAPDSGEEANCRDLARLCRNLPVPCQVMSRDGRVLAVNAAWVNLTGLSIDKIIGHGFADFLALGSQDLFRQRLAEAGASGRISLPLLNVVRKDGSLIPVAFEMQFSDETTAEPEAAICFLQDVSMQVRMTGALKDTERRFRAVFDNARDIIFIKDNDLRYVHINQATEQLMGLSAAEMLGKTIGEIIGPERAKGLEATEHWVLTGQVVHVERMMLLKGGNRILDTILVPITDDEGRVVGLCGTARDITVRRQAEDALRASLQTSADIVASIPSGLIICRYEAPDGLYLTGSNPEAEALTSISAEKCSGHRLDELLPEARRLGLYAELVRVMETGRTYRTDSFAYKDNRFDTVLRIRAFRMPRNCLGVAFEDISERMRAYEVLRSSEKRYRFLYRNAPVMLHSIDTGGFIVSVSDYWLHALGYERGDVIGRRSTDFLTPESRRYAEETVLPEFFRTGISLDIPYRMIKKNGEVIDVLLSAVAERDATGTIVQLLAVSTDVTPLKRAENAARRFARAVEQSYSAILIADPDGNIEYVNPSYTKITGRTLSDVVGRHFLSIPTTESGRRLYRHAWTTAREEGVWSGVFQGKTKTGEMYWARMTVMPVVNDAGTVINCVVNADDITEEIRMQQRLAEADKMSAVGLLAAGVAHEFKNYLCGITGNATFMLEDLGEGEASSAVRQTLGTILDIAERANGLASSLLSYSRSPVHEFETTDVRAIVDSTLLLVRQEMKTLAIDVVTYYEETPSIRLAPGRIQQLLLNLLINAIHAIKSHGIITIGVTAAEDRVVLTVGDTGRGISPENLGMVFNPFFSTKEIRDSDRPGGVGMGLAICRNIAREHGGELMVDSISGAGSVFTLTLPRDPDGDQTVLPEGVGEKQRVVLWTMELALLEWYFPESRKLRLRLFMVTSPDGLNQLEPDCAFVLIDAQGRNAEECRRVIEDCRQRGLRAAVIRARQGAEMSEPFAAHEGLPELAQIIVTAPARATIS